MTTAPTQVSTPALGGGVLLGAASLAGAAGLVVAAAGALSGSSEALLGALVGAGLVVTVMLAGNALVDVVAGLMPAASLLFAVLTYTLQVLVLGVALVVLERSGLLDSSLDRRWLGGAVIAAVLGWTLGHVVLATRARIPVYDLPEHPPAGRPSGVPSGPVGGGER